MSRFDWTCLIACAEKLSESFGEKKIGEASCRSAISRACYASFHQAKSFAENNLHEKIGSSPHQSLRLALQRSHVRAHQKISNQLKDLHRSRINADYKHTFRGNPKATAHKSIALAKRIVGEIRGLERA